MQIKAADIMLCLSAQQILQNQTITYGATGIPSRGQIGTTLENNLASSRNV